MSLSEVIGQDAPSSAEFELLREANHRIANHLSVLLSMIKMQASAVVRGPETLKREDVAAMLNEAAGKVMSVSHLHRRLSAKPEADTLDLSGFLIEGCAHLMESLGLARRVRPVQRLDVDCRVTPEQAQQIGLLVNEVIMNAAKHAHPTGLPVAISISCHNGADGRVLLTIADDGVGLPEDFDLKKPGGVGFRLIRSLADSLKADLSIESDSLGLAFRLKLPPTIKSRQLTAVATD